MYKYELHCHTKEVSKCSAFSAKDLALHYKDNGYDGIVITDHYSLHTFCDEGLFSPQNHAEKFLRGYNKAKEMSDENFSVLCAMELRFFYNFNDYLVYGIDEEFLKRNGNLLVKGLRKFYNLCEENNLLVVQAHPFRKGLFRANPRFLHGVEINNGKDKTNHLSVNWAEENDIKIRTGGSDCHRESNSCTSGILTDIKISTNEDLLRVLRNNEFEIIKTEG